MKRRYKLLLIILVGIIVTIIINATMVQNNISLVALGDGVALGMTSYNVVGYSYNDYLKEDLDNNHKLQSFNNEFSIQHLTIEELNEHLEDNTLGNKSKTPFKQILAKADLVLLSVGMDEFIDYSIKNKINEDRIAAFVNEYRKFIKSIRIFYDGEIIIIGLYPAYDFSKNIVYEINKQLETIAVDNKAKFLDITALSLNPEYYSNNISYYMNYKGHKAIYNQLKKI